MPLPSEVLQCVPAFSTANKPYVIMRAFVKLRKFLSSSKNLAAKLSLLERKMAKHDEEISAIFGAIRQLMAPPEPKKKGAIGFRGRKDA
jgi:hypothetical protein